MCFPKFCDWCDTAYEATCGHDCVSEQEHVVRMAERVIRHERWEVRQKQWIHFLSMMPYHKPRLPADPPRTKEKVTEWVGNILIGLLIFVTAPLWVPLWALGKLSDFLEKKGIMTAYELKEKTDEQLFIQRDWIAGANARYEINGPTCLLGA